MRVTVIGTGYVGTVTGACLAFLGHRVTCVDTDPVKIEKLRMGQTPIYEPGLEELITLAHKTGGIDFQTNLDIPVRESDVIFIAVGTPPLPSGESTSYLEAAARGIGAAMDASKFRVVVNKLLSCRWVPEIWWVHWSMRECGCASELAGAGSSA